MPDRLLAGDRPVRVPVEGEAVGLQLLGEGVEPLAVQDVCPGGLDERGAEPSVQRLLPRHALGVAGERLGRVPVAVEGPVLVPHVDVRVVEVGPVLRVGRVRHVVRVRVLVLVSRRR